MIRWPLRVAVGASLGRYRLMQPLGAGGMAEVFRARTRGPGGFQRDVVVKRIQPEHGGNPEFVRMFVEEAKLLGMLHHPNIVDVYDFGEDRGTLYLVMEYVEGPSLSRVLRARRDAARPIPAGIVAYVGREICRALAYVHSLTGPNGRPLRIVHRDVTPSNIMLGASGAIKLLDFGVAKSERSPALTHAGTVKGKPAYLAPEQIDGRRVDGRVDLFALGVVLYEMLTLEHLFAAERDLLTLRNVCEMAIPRPAERRADIPPELDATVMRALERDPERRFPSAAEMACALDEVVLASRVHVEDLVTLAREAGSAAPAPAAGVPPDDVATAAIGRGRVFAPRAPARPWAGDNDRTERDLGVRIAIPLQHVWTRAPVRGAAVAGVALVAVALAAMFGLKLATAAPKEPPPRITRTANVERTSPATDVPMAK